MYQNRERAKKPKQDNLIFGIRVVIEAINSGKQVDKLFIQRGLKGDLITELIQLVRAFKINIQTVPIEKLNRITRKNHQGVVGFLSPIAFQDIEDLLPTIYEKGEIPFLLILDRLTDVRNFGAITRTAECAGIHAIIVPEKERAMIGPDAIKTSAGALFKIPICTSGSLKRTATFLQDSGVKLVACTEKTDKYHFQPDYKDPICIIMGSEEDGISDDLIRKSDYLAKIPMSGTIGSLNVSVACGVIIYEAVRQRDVDE